MTKLTMPGSFYQENPTMYAFDVSKYLIENYPLTNFDLNNLLYYLSIRRIINNRHQNESDIIFIKGPHGPVNPTIYKFFQSYQGQTIDRHAIERPYLNLSKVKRNYIDKLINEFKTRCLDLKTPWTHQLEEKLVNEDQYQALELNQHYDWDVSYYYFHQKHHHFWVENYYYGLTNNNQGNIVGVFKTRMAALNYLKQIDQSSQWHLLPLPVFHN